MPPQSPPSGMGCCNSVPKSEAAVDLKHVQLDEVKTQPNEAKPADAVQPKEKAASPPEQQPQPTRSSNSLPKPAAAPTPKPAAAPAPVAKTTSEPKVMTPKQGPPARSPSSLAKLSPQLASAVNAEKLASAATPPSGMPPGMEGRSPSLKKMGSSGTKKAQTAALEEAEVAVAAGVAAAAWAAEAPAAVGPADAAPNVVSPEEQLKSSVSSLVGGGL